MVVDDPLFSPEGLPGAGYAGEGSLAAASAAPPATRVAAAAPPPRHRSPPRARATRRAAVRLRRRTRTSGLEEYHEDEPTGRGSCRIGVMRLWHRLSRPSTHAGPDRRAGLGAARPPRQAGHLGRRGPRRRHPVDAGLPPGRAAADALRRGVPRPDCHGVPAGLALRHPPRHLRVDPPAPGQVRHRGRHRALLRRQGHGHRPARRHRRRTSRSSPAPPPRRWPIRASPTPRPTGRPATAIASSWPPAARCASTTSRRGPSSRTYEIPGASAFSDVGAERALLRGHAPTAALAHRHGLARRRPGSADRRGRCRASEAGRADTGLAIDAVYAGHAALICWPPTRPGNMVSIDWREWRHHRGSRQRPRGRRLLRLGNRPSDG